MSTISHVPVRFEILMERAAGVAFLKCFFYFYMTLSIPMKIKLLCCDILRSPHPLRLVHSYLNNSRPDSFSPILLKITTFLFFLAAMSHTIQAQSPVTVNVNYNNMHFRDANRFHKKGTQGTTVGSRTLYTNVITVGSTSVDCIITTLGKTNGDFMLPTGNCPGTIPFDFRETQNCPTSSEPATTLTDNEDRFFTPTFYFNDGGGSFRLKFEFIAGGSYNDATDKGRPVILQNVLINSYDIDGNANCSTPTTVNQFNDFSGFNSAARATPGSLIAASYNAATGMTRFMSTSNCNKINVKDPNTRIRVEYRFLQEFEIEMGMTGKGRAFYMIDFGPGGATFSPDFLYSPVLDLNTNSSGDGYNNVTSFCSTPEPVSRGLANIQSVNNAIEEITITVSAAEILDNNAEILTPDFSSTSDHIQLGTPFTGIQPISAGGIPFDVQKSEYNGMKILKFRRSNGSTMTNAVAEALLDALVYFNGVNTPGIRKFTIWMKEGLVTSTFATFEVHGGCVVLSADIPELDAKVDRERVLLSWEQADALRYKNTEIERASGGSSLWTRIYQTNTASEDGVGRILQHWDNPSGPGLYRYRIVMTDFNSKRQVSAEKTIRLQITGAQIRLYPNPVINGTVHINLAKAGMIQVFNSQGAKMYQSWLGDGGQKLALGHLRKGQYYLISDQGSTPFIVQ